MLQLQDKLVLINWTKVALFHQQHLRLHQTRVKAHTTPIQRICRWFLYIIQTHSLTGGGLVQVSALKELASSKTSFVQQLKELEIKLKTKDLSLKEQSFSGSAKTTTFAWYEVLLFLSLFGSIFFSFSSCNGQFYPKMTNYSELKIALG